MKRVFLYYGAKRSVTTFSSILISSPQFFRADYFITAVTAPFKMRILQIT